MIVSHCALEVDVVVQLPAYLNLGGNIVIALLPVVHGFIRPKRVCVLPVLVHFASAYKVMELNHLSSWRGRRRIGCNCLSVILADWPIRRSRIELYTHVEEFASVVDEKLGCLWRLLHATASLVFQRNITWF